jgi:predicted secreted protein
MGWVSGIALYIVIWWTAIFAVLPWGVRQVEDPETGHDRGAPQNPMLLKKALWTSLVAGVIWFGVYLVVTSDLLSFRAMVADW